MTPEKIVQNKILNYLHLLKEEGLPLFYERRQAGGFSYKMGIPDVYAVYNGKHIEIEVKAPGKQLRPMQIKFKDMCERNNTKYICVDNIDDFKDFFNNVVRMDDVEDELNAIKDIY